MYKETFLGIFGIREPDLAASMPVEHACGLWQSWELPDGDYIVQPVDEQYTPLGDSYLLDRMDFITLLAPVAVTTLEHTGLPKPAIDAASPDLLEYWYKQEKDNGSERRAATSGPADTERDDGDNMEMLLDDALANSPVAVDEHMFSPVWHPDEALSVPEESTEPVYPVEKFPMLEGTASPKEGKKKIANLFGATNVNQPGEDAWKTRRQPVDSDIFQEAATESIPQEQPMLKAMDMPDLEAHMREEFNNLLKQAGDHPQPALEQKFVSLITSEGPFTEEHKFLFSEFGLALRRKRKHYLALAAHKRALGLAPDDEHIFFNVARAEYELGNTEHAKASLEKALALAPEFMSAVSFLSFLNSTSGIEGEKHP